MYNTPICKRAGASFEKEYRTKDQRRRVAVEGDFKAYSRVLSDRHGSADILDSKSYPQLQSFE